MFSARDRVLGPEIFPYRGSWPALSETIGVKVESIEVYPDFALYDGKHKRPNERPGSRQYHDVCHLPLSWTIILCSLCDVTTGVKTVYALLRDTYP